MLIKLTYIIPEAVDLERMKYCLFYGKPFEYFFLETRTQIFPICFLCHLKNNNIGP